MSDLRGGIGDLGDAWPFDDEEAEALLAGGGTGRDELVTLDRFLHELRAPQQRLHPEPSEELAKLFSGASAGGFGTVAPEPGRVGPAGRKPVRKLVKVAVATTTAALAVTLAAAAQVLPNSRTKTSISVSGPATPVRLDAGQQAATATSGVSAGASGGVAVQRPAVTSTTRPSSTTRPVVPVDVSALSVEALARLPLDVLRTLPAEALIRLPVDVLRTLPGDALARLPVDILRTLPSEALARLPVEVLATLPVDALVHLPVDVLRTLPGDTLARLPIDLLLTLPPDVQARLPADVLRLLRLISPATVTTTTTATTAATSPPRP